MDGSEPAKRGWDAQAPGGRREARYSSFCRRSPRTCTAMKTMITLTTTPMPPKVAIRPMSLVTAALASVSIGGSLATEGAPVSVAFLKPPGPLVAPTAPGEVPERLNGRDWKSRNGGNLVRGFESLPLRFRWVCAQGARAMGVYRVRRGSSIERTALSRPPLGGIP